jgi:hypothetical protein
LFLSTAEKLGAELLAPELLVPELLPPEDDAPDDPDMPDEPPALLPDAAGEDEDLSLLLEEEPAATATLDSANSAAAVAALRSLRFNMGKPPREGWERPAPCRDARHVPFHPPRR